MLDSAPKESEKISWAYVGAWILVIYFTIPFARALRAVMRETVGLQVLLIAGAILVPGIAYLSVRNLRNRNQPLAAHLWLLGILAVFLGYIYLLREIPEEALHVAQYGILGLLVYRALAHRMRDTGIYLAATLIVGAIGVIDEYIQWAVPSRYFDLRDIRTNFIAGGLSQLAIFAGMRPAIIAGMPGVKSRGRLCYLAAGMLAILALGFQNTPQRIAWYAAQVPGLSYLLDSKSMMVEYGYLYDNPDTGVFRSRFSPEQLQRLDRQRGIEVAAILDRYIRGEGYSAFLSIHTVPRDAYAHEAGVHLFRREYHFDRAREKNDKQGEHYNIAFHENRILSVYFPTALKRSLHYWTPDIALEVQNGADRHRPYQSTVSQSVITRLKPWQVTSLFAIAIALLILAGIHLGRLGPRKQDRIG